MTLVFFLKNNNKTTTTVDGHAYNRGTVFHKKYPFLNCFLRMTLSICDKFQKSHKPVFIFTLPCLCLTTDLAALCHIPDKVAAIITRSLIQGHNFIVLLSAFDKKDEVAGGFTYYPDY